jgi:hypothetical protein
VFLMVREGGGDAIDLGENRLIKGGI